VTLEDVLEELVGEIIDESDRPIEDLWPQKDRAVHALSTVELLKLTERLGMPWSSDVDVHTLGGLLSSRLERISRKGDATGNLTYALLGKITLKRKETQAPRGASVFFGSGGPLWALLAHNSKASPATRQKCRDR
jgi:Mg2+/Co2+ transporter CorB